MRKKKILKSWVGAKDLEGHTVKSTEPFCFGFDCCPDLANRVHSWPPGDQVHSLTSAGSSAGDPETTLSTKCWTACYSPSTTSSTRPATHTSTAAKHFPKHWYIISLRYISPRLSGAAFATHYSVKNLKKKSYPSKSVSWIWTINDSRLIPPNRKSWKYIYAHNVSLCPPTLIAVDRS